MASGCKKKDFPKYPANYREYAYVTNGGNGTVTVLDVVNLRLDRVLGVGMKPVAVTVSPTRNEAYVVSSGSGTVSVINTEKNQIATTIPVHMAPASIDVDAEGERAYVANSGSNNVSVLDLKTHREIATIGTGEAPAVARISPDRKSLVVTNRGGNSVSIFDPQSGKLRNIFSGCQGATDAVILPDSSKTFVACTGSHFVMALALANAEHGDQLLTMLRVGQTPVHLALKPDGGEVFVSNFDSNTISEISTWTNDVGGAYLMGAHPSRGIVSRDNALLYVGNFNADRITVYSIEDGKRIDANGIPGGDGPDAMAFSAVGHLLFAVNAHSGDVSVIRTQTRSLFTMLPAGPEPNAIAIKSFRVQ